MPSLKDLRNRITSVKSTQKITKAMKMVAAAKLRKAQENAEKGRAYSEKMNQIINNLKSSITDASSAPKLLAGTGKSDVHLCLVMTADRGLCGGFNTNIVTKARENFNKVINIEILFHKIHRFILIIIITIIFKIILNIIIVINSG